uniref:translation initiation factor IF-2-like n=1 Tax=Ictidomys tridecemlineatus TaxID=43179 RepID=UPI001A9CDAF7|nr:translation initiation factor IF-2-like [Ictidomys tridecemlineatus]
MYKAQPGAPQETKEALSKSASEKLNGEMKKKPHRATETPRLQRAPKLAGCVEGRTAHRVPHPQSSISGALKPGHSDPRPPRPGSRRQTSRITNLLQRSQPECYPPRPRRDDRRGVRGPRAGPAALRLPAPLAPADCCLSGGACRIGSPSPGLAETGGRWRGHDSSPQPWRGSWRGRSAARSRRRPPARALPAAPGSGSPATAPSALGAAGNASCSAVVATKFEKKGAVQIEAAGLPVPGGGEAGAQRSPYLSGGADNSRAPSSGVMYRKITAKGGRAKGGGWLQDKTF